MKTNIKKALLLRIVYYLKDYLCITKFEFAPYVVMVFCCITPYLREARKLFLHENASFLMLLRGNRDFSSKVAPRSLQIETEGRDL